MSSFRELGLKCIFVLSAFVHVWGRAKGLFEIMNALNVTGCYLLTDLRGLSEAVKGFEHGRVRCPWKFSLVSGVGMFGFDKSTDDVAVLENEAETTWKRVAHWRNIGKKSFWGFLNQNRAGWKGSNSSRYLTYLILRGTNWKMQWQYIRIVSKNQVLRKVKIVSRKTEIWKLEMMIRAMQISRNLAFKGRLLKMSDLWLFQEFVKKLEYQFTKFLWFHWPTELRGGCSALSTYLHRTDYKLVEEVNMTCNKVQRRRKAISSVVMRVWFFQLNKTVENDKHMR